MLKHHKASKSERGYVIAMTALLLVPMMVFAAFAVDVGSWYATADETQRAADAAALAGVVFLPKFNEAEAAALESAKKNGFIDPRVDPVNTNATVTVEQESNQGLKVTIGSTGETYFGKVVLSDIAIERFARAQYVLPVPLGNPGSSLGSGNGFGPIPGDPQENIFLAVSGYCADRRNGDLIMAGFDGSCGTVGSEHGYYDADGYVLVLDFGTNTSGEFFVQIFEPGTCGQSGEKNGNAAARLRTTVYRADDTPISDDDNLVAAKRWADLPSGTTSSYEWHENSCSGWTNAYRVNPDTWPGRWFMRLQTDPDTDESGWNSFGVRVVPTSTLTPCGSLNPNNPCPRVFAKNWLSIAISSTMQVNQNADGTGGNSIDLIATNEEAIFYLAEIPSVHAGKTLELTMFDPGEGMDNIQIVDPNSLRYPFTYVDLENAADNGNNDTCQVATADEVTPPAMTGINLACLDVNSSRFQNNVVKVSIDIPNGYSCPTRLGETDCWWRVRYDPDPGQTVQDRTTWQIRVVGDPVRLTE